MNKRGISAIVATVLIILITVAAISIIWVAILPMVKTGLEFSALGGRVSVVSGGGYTLYDSSRGVAMVQVKREPDEGVMNRIVVSFLVDGNSVSSSVVAPSSGGTKTYAFDLSGYGSPESVSVAPIFVLGEGKEKVGAISSDVDLKSGTIGLVALPIYDLEEDYVDENPMGIISWWEFDGNVVDSVGGNDGSLAGDGDELVGGELVLDGAGDHVNLGGWFDYQEFSISMWLNPGSSQDVYADIVDNNHDGNSNWVIQQNAGNTNVYSFEWILFTLTANVWQHLLIVREGTTCYIYIDGGLDNSGTCWVSGINYDASPSRNLNFGSHHTISGRDWTGSFDDIMIFDRALSSVEVNAIYEDQAK